MRYFINDTSFFDPLDEGIASAVVSDRQTQRIFRLDYLDFLWPTFSVCKDEVVEADLAAKQLRHVDFMWVQCAEQNLEAKKYLL